MKIQEKVVVLFEFPHEIGLRRLREEVAEVVQVAKLDMPRLLAEIEDASVLDVCIPTENRNLVRSTTTKLIKHGTKLKALAMLGHAGDLLDPKVAASHHLPILYSTVYDHAVAELAITLMLCTARKVQYLGQEFRAGRFHYKMRTKWSGEELNGKIVGIIGLGQIGRCLAQICKLGFNMKVLAYDPYIEGRVASDLGVDLASDLSQLLEASDFVCLTASLADETRHIIGTKELDQMKRSAYLINITPGLVDEKALIQALESGKIGGAGLDVFDPDPPEDTGSPLFKLPNVTVTPHIGGLTKETLYGLALENAEAIIAFLRGKPVTWIDWP